MGIIATVLLILSTALDTAGRDKAFSLSIFSSFFFPFLKSEKEVKKSNKKN